jgi:hypothetical protein
MRKEGVALKGPVDHDVPVLAVRAPDGKLRAVVFGYACHATTLDFYQWCGDHPGFAELALEKNLPGVEAMFWQGCGADQNPLPRRTVELCKEYGNMLAKAVEQTVAKPMRQIAPRLQTRFEFITLDFDRQPTLDELKQLAKRTNYQGRWAKRLARQLEEGKPLGKNCRYPVQAWKLGKDQLWITLGGEVVVDYALLCKEEFGPETWIAGYTNDVMAYIPSDRVRKEGGYEAGAFEVYGQPTHTWCPDIEQRVTGSVRRLVKSMK